jgi:hypothetical protein
LLLLRDDELLFDARLPLDEPLLRDVDDDPPDPFFDPRLRPERELELELEDRDRDFGSPPFELFALRDAVDRRGFRRGSSSGSSSSTSSSSSRSSVSSSS